jgi:hypothetical protein
MLANLIVTGHGEHFLTSRTKAIDEKFCGSCGEPIKIAAEICPHCGVRQLDPPRVHSDSADKNRVLAIVLALFLGGFGIHKFYLGKPGQGILYLVLFWTWLPAIIALVEMFRYLFMSDEEFQARWP